MKFLYIRRKFVDTLNLLILEKHRSLKFIPKKRLRSSIEKFFDWKMDSFLCARKAIRKYSTVERVETLPLVKAFINCCLNCDIWGNEVHTHLLSCNDLVAEEEDF